MLERRRAGRKEKVEMPAQTPASLISMNVEEDIPALPLLRPEPQQQHPAAEALPEQNPRATHVYSRKAVTSPA